MEEKERDIGIEEGKGAARQNREKKTIHRSEGRRPKYWMVR